MDKIKLQGEPVGNLVTVFELTPDELKAQLKPDLSQLKVEDTVWVERRIDSIGSDWVKSANEVYSQVELPEKLSEDICDGIEGDIIKSLNNLIDVVREMKDGYEKAKS